MRSTELTLWPFAEQVSEMHVANSTRSSQITFRVFTEGECGSDMKRSYLNMPFKLLKREPQIGFKYGILVSREEERES